MHPHFTWQLSTADYLVPAKHVRENQADVSPGHDCMD